MAFFLTHRHVAGQRLLAIVGAQLIQISDVLIRHTISNFSEPNNAVSRQTERFMSNWLQPRNVYRVDVHICGTAYVRADSEADARLKLQTLEQGFLTCTDGDVDGKEIFHEGSFNDPDLPELSLSPAMTIICAEANDSFELVDSE